MNIDSKIFENIQNITISVFGDYMLDRYMWGRADRLSPESPVPVVIVESETESLGGAGNVVANIRGFGINVIPIGIIGIDPAGLQISKKLADIGCSDKSFIVSEEWQSIIKSRVLAQNQHVVRIDYENGIVQKSQVLKLKENVFKAIDKSNALVISDYGKGTCQRSILKDIIKYANAKKIPLLVDPKGNKLRYYKNCTCIKPNLNEANREVSHNLKSIQDIEKVMLLSKKRYNFDNIVLTRGSDGMSVLDNGIIHHFPTDAKEVYNVAGAGDTVMAILAVCFSLGIDVKLSAKLANVAAGIVVSQLAPNPIKLNQLLKIFNQ